MELPTSKAPVADPSPSAIEAALRALPDGCARSVGELADRIGIDKLVLIHWTRVDVRFALLAASKVRQVRL
jgi:hypothetical protein